MSRRAPVRRLLACWGNGDFGRLGLGLPCRGVQSPAVCHALDGSNVKQVACGGAHTAAVTENGEVWTFGLNDCGQLGHSADRHHQAEPVLAAVPEAVKSVAAGHYHTLCLAESGNVWAFGLNDNGQLGLETEVDKHNWQPRKVKEIQGISSIAASAAHSLAISEGGELYSWGVAAGGRLGHGQGLASSHERWPRLIRALVGVKVKSAAAGHTHSGCVDVYGNLWTWGCGHFYQLGHGHSLSDVHEPLQVADLKSIVGVSLGGQHGIAVASGGATYSWGSNENGALGTGIDNYHCSPPEQIPGLALDHASCGWRHSAGVTPHGQLLTWGSGGSVGEPSAVYEPGDTGSGGQLGLGNDFDYWTPTAVEFEGMGDVRVVQVSCGFNHTAAVLDAS